MIIGLDEGNYTNIIINLLGCSSVAASATLSDPAGPSAPNITGDTEVCTGDTITNLATTATGTIVWSSSNTGVATINSSTGEVTSVSVGSTNITYTVVIRHQQIML